MQEQTPGIVEDKDVNRPMHQSEAVNFGAGSPSNHFILLVHHVENFFHIALSIIRVQSVPRRGSPAVGKHLRQSRKLFQGH